MLIFCLLLFVAVEAKLPKQWKVCKLSDRNHNECMKNALNEAYVSLLNGNKALGVSPLDPLRFDHILIDQGTGPVSIKLDFFKTDVRNFKSLRTTKIQNDWKTLKLDIVIKDPVLLEGMYKINGKVLILPITGNGHFTLSLDNVRGNATMNLSEKKIRNKTYFSIDKLRFDFDTDYLRVKFDNLFNGNKQLGDNMNLFLSENWREILNELKPSISDAFGEAFRQIGNRVFSKIETKELL